MNDDTPEVREITLNADGIPLSALLAEPRHTPSRAVVVAVHGGGMRAGYFDGRAAPGQSLLELGARLGWTVLAVDRPGYGGSARRLPEGQTLGEQALTLHAGLADFANRYDTGAGFLMIAHSFGGKLALTAAAAQHGVELIGLDISGCGHRYAVETAQLPTTGAHGNWRLNWGVLRLYPPNAFRLSGPLVARVPALEAREAHTWPQRFPEIAASIRAPVRFTFAEHELWWRHSDEEIVALTGLLSSSRVVVDRLPNAGHNISLGWAARSYHLRALAFLEECLLERQVALSRH